MPKVVLKSNESVDKALRRLKKKMDKEGIIKSIKRHRHYEKPSDKRRRIKRSRQNALISDIFSISTIWNSWRQVATRPLLEEIGRLGFSRVELNAQFPRYLLDSMAEEAARGGFLVGSLHNFCPAPPAGEEGDSLASPREKIRARAVRNTVLTVEAAARLGASAVVLHLGQVPPRRSARRLQAWTERGLAGTPKFLRLLERVRARRARRVRPYLESVVRSLRELAPPAEGLGVRLGLETRYHPWEIPSFPEIGEILDFVASPALGYWHDLGHARVRETLGEEPALSYLERYGKRLIGMHIHDVVVTRDHKAPGEGEMDFSPYRRWLADKSIHKVFEIHPGASPEEIIRGRILLENLVGA